MAHHHPDGHTDELVSNYSDQIIPHRKNLFVVCNGHKDTSQSPGHGAMHTLAKVEVKAEHTKSDTPMRRFKPSEDKDAEGMRDSCQVGTHNAAKMVSAVVQLNAATRSAAG